MVVYWFHILDKRDAFKIKLKQWATSGPESGLEQ